MKKSRIAILILPLLISAKSWGAGDQGSEEIIKKILITGSSAVPESRILDILPFKAGESLTPQNKKLSKEMVQSLLRNKGYLIASVTTDWRNENSQGVFSIQVQEGPLYRFGKTEVNGLTTLPMQIVDMEKTYQEGDPYNRQELFRTQTRLYQTGLLEDIRIQTSTTPNRTADVKINVKQQKLKWIKGGVGWGSEEKERFTLTFNHDNVWHKAHQFQIYGTISRIWKEYKSDYTIPYFWGTRTEQQTSLSWRGENRDGYDSERILGSFALGRSLSFDMKGTVAYQFNRTNTFNVDPELTSISPSRSSGRSINVGLNRDKANDPFFPTRGTRTNLHLERSGGILGGTLDFNKATMDWKAYKSLKRSFVLAGAIRTGVVKEFSPSPDVPIFERLFIGGANSVRGYKERGVGPRDSIGNPLGGKWKLGSTLEMRFPLVWKLTGAIFLDGGQVGNRSSDVNFNEWKYSSGGGLRFQTPVGPIRLDYGYKLNRDQADNSPWRFHFSLGESF